MRLGDRIYRLRTEKNLSQGNLADLLDVSRQSISKWETNVSVPDLDKLLKLSDIFGVTLDALVRNEEAAQVCVEDAGAASGTNVAGGGDGGFAGQASAFPPRKIIGTVLLCMGFFVALLLTLFGALLGGLILASPCLLCGIICFACRRRVGLWCAWIVALLVDIYLRYSTGINWRLTFYTLSYTPEMNYVRLAFAWVQLVCVLALITVTFFSFRNYRIAATKRNQWYLIGGWAFFVALHIPVALTLLGRWFIFVFAALDWGRIVLLTALLIYTAGVSRDRKASGEISR